MTIIGKMVEKVKDATTKAVTGLVKNGRKLISTVLVLSTMLSTSLGLTGCAWIEFFGSKPKELPDENDVKIEVPVEEETLETENALPDNIPQVDKDAQSPVVGGGDETEAVINPQPKPDDSTETDAPETETETETEKDSAIGSVQDIVEANKIENNLKTAINSSLQNYFDQTETLTSARYTVQEIVSVKATGENLEVSFTTKTANGRLGYNVVKVGNSEHNDEVVAIVGNNYEKGLYVLPVEDITSVFKSACDAVNATGITNNNMKQHYVAHFDVDTTKLHQVVIAYYETLKLGGENCKKTEDGYTYYVDVCTLNIDGESTKTIEINSSRQINGNQLAELVKEKLESLNQDENELGNDLGL